MPNVVHIAGTNGKGSTLAILKAIAEADGRRVHAYSSPHLVAFNERIVLNGAPVDDARLLDALARIEAANAAAPITFFEVTTAAAFLLFAETPADLLILETGLGGRFDATNVVADPALTLVTPVSLDHREFLGDNVADIAREKAGIFKVGAPAFSGPQEEAAREALLRAAAARGVRLELFHVHFGAHAERGGLVYQDDARVLDLPALSLHGAHQIQNAGLAIRAGLHLGIGRTAIAEGLKNAA